MSFRSGFITGILAGLAAAVAALVIWWPFGPAPAPDVKKPPPAAQVDKEVKEAELNRVVLTPKAVKRLGIEAVPMARRRVPRLQQLGGEVVIPPGQAVQVAAPLAGTVMTPAKGPMPIAGSAVKKGETVLQFTPILTPDAKVTLATARIDAEGQVKNADTQAVAAKIALDRAKALLKADAGSKRAVDEAQAQHDLAVKTLEAAQARRDLLVQILDQTGTVASLPIASPFNGVLRNISVREGQIVPSGGMLFEVMDPARVWIRVAIYAGELEAVNAAAEVQVATLSGKAQPVQRAAQPVAAPPSANPLAATVDLFFQTSNADGALRPGQRVAVMLPERGSEEALVVPWSAVVLDIHGGEWVYEQKTDTTFVRQRVQVRWVTDGVAILATGPAPGVSVVARGAQELYAIEVGFSK